MARCPKCGEILDDSWLKKVGAVLMGKSSSPRKGNSREVSKAAAQKRWGKGK